MRAEMERCAREGTPRPESTAVRAHVPAAFWFFANAWNDLFRNGVCDHAIKELCRLYVSRAVQCEYCGNQRSVKTTTTGAWSRPTSRTCSTSRVGSLRRSPEGGARLCRGDHVAPRHGRCAVGAPARPVQRAELVELGCMIGLTLGQQSWLRLLDIEHHQVMAGERRLDGAGLRRSRRARAGEVVRGVLGPQAGRAGQRLAGDQAAGTRGTAVNAACRSSSLAQA